MKRIFNYKKDVDDIRDYQFHKKVVLLEKSALPSSFQLPSLPPILDQGDLGSCTANSSSNALRFLLKKNNLNVFQPSRLYIYWFTRFIEGNTNSDSGASLRNTLKSISKYGACHENLWAYNISQFKTKPNAPSQTDAKKHASKFQYLAVKQNLDIIKNAICQGFPIVLGFLVFNSFMSNKVTATGIVPMPDPNKEKMLGGHAVLLVSYDDSKRLFGFMNSWGPNWGNKGFFYLPYDYVLSPNLAFDMWAIRFFQ